MPWPPSLPSVAAMTSTSRPASPPIARPSSGLRPPIAPRWPAPVRMTLGLVSFLVVLVGLASGLQVIGLRVDLPPVVLSVVVAVGFAGAVVGLVAGWARLERRGRHGESGLAEVGLRWTRRDAAALGVAVALVMAAILVAGVLCRLAGLAGPVPGLADLTAPAVVGGLAFALVPSFVMQAFPEELFFRGWLLNAPRVSAPVAVVLSSVLFGSIHVLSQSPATTVVERFVLYPLMATAMGFACAAARLATGSLWAAVGIHGGMHMGNRLTGLFVDPYDFGVLLLVQTVTFVLLGVLLLMARRLRTVRPGQPASPAPADQASHSSA